MSEERSTMSISTMAAMAAMTAVLASASVSCGQLTGSVKTTGDVPDNGGYVVTKLADGLAHPWGIEFLPDGAILITERGGDVRIFRDGQLDPKPLVRVPEVLVLRQGGLLDVQLHPNFAENKFVYLTHSAGTNRENRTRLVRATFDGTSFGAFETLFEATPDKGNGFHFGSRIVWLPDGTMLLAIGDGGGTRNQAQDVGSHLGKVLRLRDDGTSATGNPFYPRVDAVPEVWSYGHRNIQGMARDPVTGEIWATEHGPNDGDELNKVEAGINYGWPKATYGREYHGPRISEHTSLDGMRDPLVVWTPCIAPSGLAVYRGDKFPQWQGDVLAGGLRSRDIRRVDIENGKIVGQDKIVIGQRVRDVRVGPDGMIYVVTDEERGGLFRVEPK